MSRILAIVITYFPQEEQLLRNLGSFLDEVDRVIIWENTPAEQAPAFRFFQHPKVQYMGRGKNVGLAKAFNLALSYATDKGYDYLLTMDQDSSWENFATYKQAVVDNPQAPRALFCPVRNPELLAVQKAENAQALQALTDPQRAAFYHDRSVQLPGGEVLDLIHTDRLINSGMLASTALLNELGGYWDTLFVDGIDEELEWRAAGRGVNSYYVEGCTLQHQLGYPVRKKCFGKTLTIPGYSKERLYDRFRSIELLRRRLPAATALHERLHRDWYRIGLPRILYGAPHRLANLRAILRGRRDGRNTPVDPLR